MLQYTVLGAVLFVPLLGTATSYIILIMSKIIIIINYYKPFGDDDATAQERP